MARRQDAATGAARGAVVAHGRRQAPWGGGAGASLQFGGRAANLKLVCCEPPALIRRGGPRAGAHPTTVESRPSNAARAQRRWSGGVLGGVKPFCSARSAIRCVQDPLVAREAAPRHGQPFLSSSRLKTRSPSCSWGGDSRARSGVQGGTEHRGRGVGLANVAAAHSCDANRQSWAPQGGRAWCLLGPRVASGAFSRLRF